MNIDAKAQSAQASFVWNDPFLLDDQLEEDERMIRDAAAAFAADKLAPRIADAYMEEKTDPGIFREMGEAGLLGVTIPGRVWRSWVPATSPTAWSRARSSGSIRATAP
jgi:glutaryl-CoA dehydrogenase